MYGVRPSMPRSTPAGIVSLVPLSVCDLTASRETAAALEPPPRTVPRYAAAPPTAAPTTQRRVGFAGLARESVVWARLRNHIPAATPSRVGTMSAGAAPGRESTARTPTAPT